MLMFHKRQAIRLADGGITSAIQVHVIASADITERPLSIASRQALDASR